MSRIRFDNRVTRMLGVRVPIANSPMGGVVTPALAAAVAEAGAIGLIPGSLGAEEGARLIRATRELTAAPVGSNISVAFADERNADMLLELSVRFVTTSTGPVAPYTARLQAGGAKVFHVVTSLEAARRAADAGVDGLVVESTEGAGMRGADDVGMMVLLPTITGEIDLPVIAAGGIADGRSMAAAFALGAEGVQMGTRFVASAESAVHANFKQAIVEAKETDTLLMNRGQKSVRALRTATTAPFEADPGRDPLKELIRDVRRLYEQGDLTAGFASVGQVGGRIKEVLPAAEIIRRTVEEFDLIAGRLAGAYVRG
jgi:enoyl-[acyl-carrier protein] reductase II